MKREREKERKIEREILQMSENLHSFNLRDRER